MKICNEQKEAFLNNPWTWKEFVLLLTLTFVIVPLLIESLLRSFFESVFTVSLFAGALMGLTMAIIFLMGIYVIAIKPKRLSLKAVGLIPFPKRYWSQIILWTIGLIAASTIVLFVMETVGGTYENAKTESIQQQAIPFKLLIAFLSACIVSPFYEEIVYRGFFYKWLRCRWGLWPGLLASSVIFMLVHIPTYNTLPINLITGLAFAWTYEKTGSVIPGMIIHSLYNGVAILLTVFAP